MFDWYSNRAALEMARQKVKIKLEKGCNRPRHAYEFGAANGHIGRRISCATDVG